MKDKQGFPNTAISVSKIDGLKKVPLYYCGPSVEEGPLPALFYFALSGEESLGLSPFNLPIQVLQDVPLRVFSITLPAHGQGYDRAKSVAFWKDKLLSGDDIITDFIKLCCEQINFLIDHNFIDPAHLAVAGLSRGAFIASHLAAYDSRINTILGFSRLTKLSGLQELGELQNDPRLAALDLYGYKEQLVDKHMRYYIGNHDTLVGTRDCFELIAGIVETAAIKKMRSIPIELSIYPSIGHKGHGTPPHIFYEGAQWIKHRLLS